MARQPFGPWPRFQFLNIHTVGRTPRTGDQSVAGPLPTYRTTQEQNKSTQTSIPRVSFDPTIPAFEDISCLGPSGHSDRLSYFISSSMFTHNTLPRLVTVKITVSWNVTPCSVVYKCFAETCCLRLHSSLPWRGTRFLLCFNHTRIRGKEQLF
jgi:hypothetical protein